MSQPTMRTDPAACKARAVQLAVESALPLAQPVSCPRALRLAPESPRSLLGHIAKNLQFSGPIDLCQHLFHTAKLTVCDQVLDTVGTLKHREILDNDNRVLPHFKWEITGGGT